MLIIRISEHFFKEKIKMNRNYYYLFVINIRRRRKIRPSKENELRKIHCLQIKRIINKRLTKVKSVGTFSLFLYFKDEKKGIIFVLNLRISWWLCEQILSGIIIISMSQRKKEKLPPF